MSLSEEVELCRDLRSIAEEVYGHQKTDCDHQSMVRINSDLYDKLSGLAEKFESRFSKMAADLESEKRKCTAIDKKLEYSIEAQRKTLAVSWSL